MLVGAVVAVACDDDDDDAGVADADLYAHANAGGVDDDNGRDRRRLMRWLCCMRQVRVGVDVAVGDDCANAVGDDFDPTRCHGRCVVAVDDDGDDYDDDGYEGDDATSASERGDGGYDDDDDDCWPSPMSCCERCAGDDLLPFAAL